MRVAQSGIFALGTGSHSYMEFDLLAGGEPLALVQAIANLREPSTTTGGVNLVAGFRPELWRSVAPAAIPEEVADFKDDVQGAGFSMPATQPAPSRTAIAWASFNPSRASSTAARSSGQALPKRSR